MTSSVRTNTHYVAFTSPPTPSPSPAPSLGYRTGPKSHLDPTPERQRYLTSLLQSFTPGELLFVSKAIVPLLKRDLLSSLPPELAIHVLTFVDEPRTLVRASLVSRAWRGLALEESVWKGLCVFYGFGIDDAGLGQCRGAGGSPTLPDGADDPWWLEQRRSLEWQPSSRSQGSSESASNHQGPFSYIQHFKKLYMTILNWRYGGRLLRKHQLPMQSAAAQEREATHPRSSFFPTTFPNLYATPDNPDPPISIPEPPPIVDPQSDEQAVVTSLALDDEWVVIGLSSARIHIFSAKTGVLARTLAGHESGVWGLCLVSRSKAKDTWNAASIEEPFRAMLNVDTKQDRRKSGADRYFAPVDGRAGRAQRLPFALKVAVGLEPCTRSGQTGTNAGDQVKPSQSPVEGSSESTPIIGSESATSSSASTLSSFSSRRPFHTFVPGKQSSPCFSSDGWGQPNPIVISGGCDKTVRVWDVQSGHCIYVLPGHTSTIRCMRALHGRPTAVTGSRDGTVRVWDVQHGRAEKVLIGHEGSVRCLDVNGNRVVSGSYDTTCRIWNVDTGECLGVLRGHFHQVYSIAFDGVRVVSGGLDTTVRVWDPDTGMCLALLQGHSALVCQIQLSWEHQLLATGGADGRVITFAMESYDGFPSAAVAQGSASLRGSGPSPPCASSFFEPACTSSRDPPPLPANSLPFPIASRRATRAAYQPLHRISAHDSSVTSLQFDGRFLVTGGNDGCVRLWETETGRYVRELTEGGETVWKVGFAGGASSSKGGGGGGGGGGGSGADGAGGVISGGGGAAGTCAIMAKRGGKTVMEIWSFRPE